MNIEDLNYWNDRRVIAGLIQSAYCIVTSNNIKTVVKLTDGCLERLIENDVIPEGHNGIFEGSTSYAVCGICSGSKRIVNPSIDSGGISQEDFDDDPDFESEYLSGRYDIKCTGCMGEGLVPDIKFFDPKIYDAIRSWINDAEESAIETAHERAMGY